MSERRDIPSITAEIRRLNARFRGLKDKDGPRADAMREQKDALIDEMQAMCPHPEVFATKGARSHGVRGMPFASRRVCAACGRSEAETFGDGVTSLKGRPTAWLPVDGFLIKEGRILKRLGINL